MIRLPPPGRVYDPTQAAAVQSELERFLRRCAILGEGAQFPDLTVATLTISGTLALPPIVTAPTTFTLNGNTVSAASWAAVIAATASGGSSKAFAWMTPSGGGAGAWSARAIGMIDLPSYVSQLTASTTVTTVANNAGANVALSASKVIAANTLAVGDIIRVIVRGVYGTAIAGPNITLTLFGNAVTLATTGATALTSGRTNRGWLVEVDLIVTATGAGGAMEVQGLATLCDTAASAAQVIDMENTAPVAIATNANITLQLKVTWSAAAAANTISCRQTSFEIFQA